MEDDQINTSSSNSSNNNNNKRSIRDDDESISELPEAKRIRDSLFDDESEFLLLLEDNNNNNNSENQDIVSVMKSFEEEISLPLINKEEEISSSKNNEEEISLPTNEVEISSSSSSCGGDELTPSELLFGFLLEASDDELGLPPNSSSSSSSSNELEGEITSGHGGESGDDDMLRVSFETTTVGFDDVQIWGFEDDISRSTTTTTTTFEFDSAETVNFEGLFDYCDVVVNNDDVLSLCGISDFSDFSCRSEWLTPPVL